MEFDLNEYTVMAEGGEESTSRALHNGKGPNINILREKPEHRLVLMMKLQGMTNTEIVERFKYTHAWLSQITRQPWFRVALIEEMEKAGRRNIDELMSIEAENSLETLVELRDTSKSDSVKYQSAANILDRVLGKPLQRVESKVQFSEKVTDIDKIDKEIAELNEQLNANN